VDTCAIAAGNGACGASGRPAGHVAARIMVGSPRAAQNGVPDLRRNAEAAPMTTLVAVRKNDEIAIAADSLTTFGDTRLSAEFDRTPDKIIKYRETFIGLCGSAAHQLVFESLLAKHGDLDFADKAGIFETFRKLHPILKEQHFLNPKEEEDDPYESTQITALVANRHGIFGVYSMREVFEYTRFWAAGTGREFALGAMHTQYARLRTAEAIARAGIEAGTTFDKNSGLPLTLYTIAVES
jgi:ATP-dependent protease HslVU (ClpYQ) peptidase subunit